MCLKKQCLHQVLPPMTWVTPQGKPQYKRGHSTGMCPWCTRTIAVGKNCRCPDGLEYYQSHLLQQVMYWIVSDMFTKFGPVIYTYYWTKNTVTHMSNRAYVWANDPSFVKPLPEWIHGLEQATDKKKWPKNVAKYWQCIEAQLRAQAPKIE